MDRSLLLVFVVCFVVGCSSSEEKAPPLQRLGTHHVVQDTKCQDGESRVCAITFEQANGVLSCYRGEQTCEGESWGPCTDGHERKELDPREANWSGFQDRTNQSLSTPSVCHDNPCDPTCLVFFEDPPDIGLGGGTGAEPPAPGGSSCVHDLCEAGIGLAESCDSCVTLICSQHPECCEQSDPQGWHESCAELVGPLCANEAPTLPLCKFSLFTQGDLILSPGSAVSAGSIGAAGRLTLESSTAEETILGGTDVTLDGGTYGSAIYVGNHLKQTSGTFFDATRVYENLSVELPTVPTRSLSCAASSGISDAHGRFDHHDPPRGYGHSRPR